MRSTKKEGSPAGRALGVLGLCVLGLVACGSEDDAALADAQGEDTAWGLMTGEDSTWSVLSTAPVMLKVCWENPDAAAPLVGETSTATGAQRREWVRLALKGSWERQARVVFTGWETCKNEGSAATPPHTLGRQVSDPPGQRPHARRECHDGDLRRRRRQTVGLHLVALPEWRYK